MHLPLARLVSMPVIYCLLPSIILYNCGLRCEVSEDMAGKISENRHFRGPHSHLKPTRQRTPPNIRISRILLETAIPGLHFRR